MNNIVSISSIQNANCAPFQLNFELFAHWNFNIFINCIHVDLIRMNTIRHWKCMISPSIILKRRHYLLTNFDWHSNLIGKRESVYLLPFSFMMKNKTHIINLLFFKSINKMEWVSRVVVKKHWHQTFEIFSNILQAIEAMNTNHVMS